MSIPLDRLYHYIEGLCSEDIIIYRWYPHGSKKLEDLIIFNENKLPKRQGHALDLYTTIHMICHDQEPLNYHYYTTDEFSEAVKQLAYNTKQRDPARTWPDFNELLELIATSHLRTKIKIPFTLHDYVLLCHSEQNSKELEIYEQNGFVGVYYWAHALIARDWFRFANYDLNLITDPKNIQHDFLIYNRAWSGTREYRLKLTELIVNYDLVKKCNMKFNPNDDGQHYKDFKFKNPSLSISRYDFETLFKLNTATSNDSADYNNADYTSSLIEVVLETLFDDQRHHLTEKALRPIACGKPFILVATPGSLKYLKSYGFKTFAGLINEEYDDIIDPADRIQAIVKEMERITLLNADEKYLLWQQLNAIAEYNKQRFFSQEFHQQVVNEFVLNLETSIKKCKSNINGKWFKIVCQYDPVSLARESGRVAVEYLESIKQSL